MRFCKLASSFLVASFGAVLVLQGCTTADVDELAVAESSELRPLRAEEIVGSIAYGDTSAPIRHTGSPEYRALSFHGNAGERVEAWVRSTDGDAIAFLANAQFKTIVTNDDAHEGTQDARLVATLPATGQYYVVFRERDREPATFTVSLANLSDCEGLECAIVDCRGPRKTTLRGRVFDPAGANPLSNVVVYIPGGPTPEVLPPIKDSTQSGIACETCASVIVNPLRSALTDAKGEFVLEDVPVGEVPIVVQVGKWRRLVKVQVTSQCGDNHVADRVLRLPRNGAEGDMPQIAVTTGGADSLECLLRGIGIDDSEFVDGHDGSGHVHLFKGIGGRMGTPAESFWKDASQLRKYDLLLLSCEGVETLENKGKDEPGARSSMVEYLNAGGRVFATHYHYVWFQSSPEQQIRDIATFRGFGNGPSSGDFDVNTTLPDGSPFPKGEILAEWLLATGASTTYGKIPLEMVRNSVQTLAEPGVSWIQKRGDPNAAPTNYFSFNTPISAAPKKQCGRAVYTDLHITDQAGPLSIERCEVSRGRLTPQQKLLEFLFFDLSACVIDDRDVPQPPAR